MIRFLEMLLLEHLFLRSGLTCGMKEMEGETVLFYEIIDPSGYPIHRIRVDRFPEGWTVGLHHAEVMEKYEKYR